jgi:hypothetical protein
MTDDYLEAVWGVSEQVHDVSSEENAFLVWFSGRPPAIEESV